MAKSKSGKLQEKVFRMIDAAKKIAKDRTAQWRLDEIQVFSAYAEPGYTQPKSGVICTGNWNRVSKYDDATRTFDTVDDTPKKLGDALEAMGVELEWSDEWLECQMCRGLVRTEPNSYQWQSSGWTDENGETVCAGCIKKNKRLQAVYLESYEGQTNSCMTFDFPLEKHGFKRLDRDFENGWYGGQDDDPRKVAAALKARGVTRFVFTLDSKGQFDLAFSVWIHKSQFKKATLTARDGKADRDPVEVLKDGLQAAGVAAASVPAGEGPVVTKINGATATARRVSPQDFADGKALD
jgi:hypothetical protein